MIGVRDARRLEAYLGGLGSAASRRRMRERIATDESLRRAHDFRIEALRALERQELASVEVDAVEARLFGGSASPSRGRVRWVGLGLAGAAAVVAWAVAVLPGEPDGLASRGGTHSSALALDVLCAPAGSTNLQSVHAGACAADGVVGFAHRVDPSAAPGASYLTLFGVGPHGEILYYAPTPADPDPVATSRGRWMSTAISVDLRVNHDPGETRVYGLLSPNRVTLADVDRWAAAMRGEDPAESGATPWIERIDAAARGTVCPEVSACESAESRFVIKKD